MVSPGAELKGTVDRIICDPPFLSEDCQTKSEHPFFSSDATSHCFPYMTTPSIRAGGTLSNPNADPFPPPPSPLSRLDRSVALQARRHEIDHLHGRAHGESSHEAVPPLRRAHDDVRALAPQRAEQPVLLLCQLRVRRVDVEDSGMMTMITPTTILMMMIRMRVITGSRHVDVLGEGRAKRAMCLAHVNLATFLRKRESERQAQQTPLKTGQYCSSVTMRRDANDVDLSIHMMHLGYLTGRGGGGGEYGKAKMLRKTPA